MASSRGAKIARSRLRRTQEAFRRHGPHQAGEMKSVTFTTVVRLGACAAASYDAGCRRSTP